MSLFTEFLELEGVDPEDFEPDEVRWLCEDSVFRIVAEYCARTRGWSPPGRKAFDATFDADELGIDPEND